MTNGARDASQAASRAPCMLFFEAGTTTRSDGQGLMRTYVFIH